MPPFEDRSWMFGGLWFRTKGLGSTMLPFEDLPRESGAWVSQCCCQGLLTEYALY
jgi:hypothetical protein